MEEIDIIELLQRVKEGKAPKEIEINGNKYQYSGSDNIQYLYENENFCIFVENIEFDTKIKILDKPIIEELPIIIGYEHEENKTLIQKNRDKINEIIKFLNNKE